MHSRDRGLGKVLIELVCAELIFCRVDEGAMHGAKTFFIKKGRNFFGNDDGAEGLL